MGELEDLARDGNSEEVLQKGQELLSNPAGIGGGIHLIKQLSQLKRHSEAISLAKQLFDQRRKPRDLNSLMSAILASGDIPKLREVIRTASEYAKSKDYSHDDHLMTTWLRALIEIDDQDEFWRVYETLCPESYKTQNPFVIAQYYQMLIRLGRYPDVIEHFASLPANVKNDDLLQKLNARAHIELGQIADAERIIRNTRGDYLRRSLEAKINEFRATRGIEGQVAENASQPEDTAKMEPVKQNRVFIVHGHDKNTLTQLENLLHRIEAEPWTFERLPKKGSPTVIELLEEYVPTADAIIVLLTPDDVGRVVSETDQPLEPRARQNALIEGGYAVISKRNRSLLIALGGVSIPTDFEGILRVQDRSWSDRVAVETAKRLKGMGLTVDPTKLF